MLVQGSTLHQWRLSMRCELWGEQGRAITDPALLGKKVILVHKA